jgi:hypothetical protein
MTARGLKTAFARDDDDTGLKTVSLMMKIRERKFAGDCVAAGLASELSVFQGG